MTDERPVPLRTICRMFGVPPWIITDLVKPPRWRWQRRLSAAWWRRPRWLGLG